VADSFAERSGTHDSSELVYGLSNGSMSARVSRSGNLLVPIMRVLTAGPEITAEPFRNRKTCGRVPRLITIDFYLLGEAVITT
jgi:hypothetical protein